ncbi:hypothetical protein [Cellulosimicrobium marinum]|uniref:hypothetical protein n=1 Tax=Cellulosimicrobium marinum TaxID=1638992 RepID=UPI001E58DD39|nr:hypothetical protein [Cellulosimicrobium marinum]MCB7136694.1 hypothetical protein [Cellulosimicrobium marinum]
MIGYLGRTELVSIPMLQEQIPVRSLVVVFAAAVVVMPLYAVLGVLSPTLVREPRLRPTRIAVILALAALTLAPTFAGEVVRAPRVVVDLRLFLALLTVGLVGVVVLGDAAGLVVLGLGFLVLLVTAAPGSWVTGLLLATPTAVLGVADAVAAALYAFRGPRSRRVDEER